MTRAMYDAGSFQPTGSIVAARSGALKLNRNSSVGLYFTISRRNGALEPSSSRCAHAAQPRRQGRLVDRGGLVVFARDDLLVVGIRALDEAREHERPAGAEADGIVTLPETDLRFDRIKAADLLARLRRHNQVGRGAAGRRHV